MAYVAVVLDPGLSFPASVYHAAGSMVAQSFASDCHVCFRTVARRYTFVHDLGRLPRHSAATAPAMAGISQADGHCIVRRLCTWNLLSADILRSLHWLCFLPFRDDWAGMVHVEGDSDI